MKGSFQCVGSGIRSKGKWTMYDSLHRWTFVANWCEELNQRIPGQSFLSMEKSIYDVGDWSGRSTGHAESIRSSWSSRFRTFWVDQWTHQNLSSHRDWFVISRGPNRTIESDELLFLKEFIQIDKSGLTILPWDIVERKSLERKISKMITSLVRHRDLADRETDGAVHRSS